jgi:hypothetical protein
MTGYATDRLLLPENEDLRTDNDRAREHLISAWYDRELIRK